jgi:hypothetical protein
MCQPRNQVAPGKTKSHGHHRMAILTALQVTFQTLDLFFSVGHTNVRTACGGRAKCLRSWAWHWMELLLLAPGFQQSAPVVNDASCDRLLPNLRGTEVRSSRDSILPTTRLQSTSRLNCNRRTPFRFTQRPLIAASVNN